MLTKIHPKVDSPSSLQSFLSLPSSILHPRASVSWISPRRSLQRSDTVA